MTGPLDRLNRERQERRITREINPVKCAEAVGPITPGCEIFGLSKGQFSLIELIEYCLEATGPADLLIATWTAGGQDIKHSQNLLRNGRIRSCRWIMDFSFPVRQPGYTAQLREKWGDETIACTANHAKFVLITNETWNIVLRTSMNLNLNRRLEFYEISDSPELAGFMRELAAAVFAHPDTSIATAAAVPTRAEKSIIEIAGKVGIRDSEITYEAHPGAEVSFE